MLHTENTPTSAEKDGTLQFLTFHLGEETYALGIGYVREIKVWSGTTRLPNTPDYVRGVMNLRGLIVPVFDLNAPFHGTPTEVTDKHVVVVLSHGEDTIGLLVDAVSDIIDTTENEIKPIPSHDAATSISFLSGLITREKRIIALLDIEKLFDLTREGMVAHLNESH